MKTIISEIKNLMFCIIMFPIFTYWIWFDSKEIEPEKDTDNSKRE